MKRTTRIAYVLLSAATTCGLGLGGLLAETEQQGGQDAAQTVQTQLPAAIPECTSQATDGQSAATNTDCNHGTCHRCHSNHDSTVTCFDPRDVIEQCTQLLRKEPNNHELHYHRAKAHMARQDYDNALIDLFEAIRLDPRNPCYFATRAAAFEGKQRYDRAVADYTAALRLKPCDKDLICMRQCAEQSALTQQTLTPMPTAPAEPTSSGTSDTPVEDNAKEAATAKDTPLTKALRSAAVAEAKAREALAEVQREEALAKAEEARTRAAKARSERGQSPVNVADLKKMQDQLTKIQSDLTALQKKLDDTESLSAVEARAKRAELGARILNAELTIKLLKEKLK